MLFCSAPGLSCSAAGLFCSAAGSVHVADDDDDDVDDIVVHGCQQDGDVVALPLRQSYPCWPIYLGSFGSFIFSDRSLS